MEDLFQLLAIPTTTGKTEAMYNHLLGVGNAAGWKMLSDNLGNLYAVKGEAETYPCVVAHMDTVHRIEKGGILPLAIGGKIFGMNPDTMRQTGIGGDDKCGIWAALHCLRVLPACKAAFFVDEESGCKGSRGCDLAFFDDCRFVLQADRRGNNDFVNRISDDPLSSDAFQEAVVPIMRDFGYTFSWGAMTDVMALRDRAVGVSVANMSAGYHNPHSDAEHIVYSELEAVCKMMERICLEVTATFRYFAPPPKKYDYKSKSKGGGSNGNSSHWWDHLPGTAGTEAHGDQQGSFPDYEGSKYKMVQCHYCSIPVPSDELIEESPPVCIDCALHKEEHGIYPVSPVGKMWQKLMGKKKFKGKKKRKNRGVQGDGGRFESQDHYTDGARKWTSVNGVWTLMVRRSGKWKPFQEDPPPKGESMVLP